MIEINFDKKIKESLGNKKIVVVDSLFETASREAFEEGGVEISEKDFRNIGYYVLPDGHTTVITTSTIETFAEIPKHSETVERKMMKRPMEKELLSFPDELYDCVFQKLGWPNE